MIQAAMQVQYQSWPVIMLQKALQFNSYGHTKSYLCVRSMFD